MGAGHRSLHLDARGPLHSLPAHTKLVGLMVMVLAVVSTPPEWWWVLAAQALVLVAVAWYARIPLGTLARRLSVELPFVVFALAMPFVGREPTVRVAGFHLSTAGLWAAWAIIAKGTLCVATTVIVASTTTVPALITGLDRLRVPRVITAIVAFMVRYGDLLAEQAQRMRIARESRGDHARWLWQAKAVAMTGGALFVRSYERGERVHLAMEARGYSGVMPAVAAPESGGWGVCLLPGVVAWLMLAGTWWMR